MGEDAQGTDSAATTLTDGTASPATAQAEGASPSAAPTGGDAAPASQEDIWAKVLELDPDELIRKYPRLQGKVGSLAQQQTQREISRFQSEWEQRQAADRDARAREQKRNELRQLAADNPDALAARVLTDVTQEEIQERNRSQISQAIQGEHQKLAKELNALYERPIVKEIWEKATPEIRAKLTWTNYNDIPSFMEAASDIISDYRAEQKVGTKAEELAKKRLEAMMKERNIEDVKADADAAKTDLNLDGLSSGTRIFTRAEIAAMPLEEYRKHKTAIRAQAAAGYIR